MIKHKWIGSIAALLMSAAVLAVGYAYVNPSAFSLVAGTARPAYASVMDKTEIMDIQIIADEAQWAEMLQTATAEEYIPATVIINGEKIETVGIRPKGNSSLSSVANNSETDRFSFKIEFDHYITGQTWLGLDKLAVNNMQGDASYMKEYLSYDIMEYAGVEAPLTAFADISVNGNAWGFYLAAECLEDSYAQRVYGSDHGILYKPEGMGMRGAGRMDEFVEQAQNGEEAPGQAPGEMPEQGQFPGGAPNVQGGGNRGGGFSGGVGGMPTGGVSLQYTSDEVSDYSAIFDNAAFDATRTDYKRVIGALDKLSKGEDLESAVDVEAVLKYFAAHTVVVNLDSYVSNMGHNYYLYEENGQLTILPWDYNLAFGGFQSGDASGVVNFPIDTPVSGVSLSDRPLLGRLLEVPEYMELYHGYLRQIVDGYCDVFEQTVDSLDAMIASHVAADPTAFYDYEAYKAAVAELKTLGALRAQSIRGQLDGTVPSTSEGQSANPDQLIDASSVNLSALGSQGGGGIFIRLRQGGSGADGQPGESVELQFSDPQTAQRAMEMIEAAGNDGLTEEQLSQLKELGLTDEQITQLKAMAQGGPGGGMGERRPGGRQDRADVPMRRDPGLENQGDAAASGLDTGAWLLIGGCAALLLPAWLFVIRFKRRKT